MILLQTLGDDILRLDEREVDRLNNAIALELLRNDQVKKVVEARVRALHKKEAK
ncbi:MAG TPA: hypothetical protein VMW27_02470 [Thermoanaerobaculia bacterium]|nr:hypothetical protein [Thermoanaerobaculia bacterium]